MALFECKKISGGEDGILVFGYINAYNTSMYDDYDVSSINEVALFNNASDISSNRNLDIYLDDVLTYSQLTLLTMINIDVSNAQKLTIKAHTIRYDTSYIMLLKGAKSISADFFFNSNSSAVQYSSVKQFDVTGFSSAIIENTSDAGSQRTITAKMDNDTTSVVAQGATSTIDITNNITLAIYPSVYQTDIKGNITIT